MSIVCAHHWGLISTPLILSSLLQGALAHRNRALTQQAFEDSVAALLGRNAGESPMGEPLLSQSLPFLTSTTTPDALGLPKACCSSLICTHPSSSQLDPLSSYLLPQEPKPEHLKPQGPLYLLFPLTSGWLSSPVDVRASAHLRSMATSHLPDESWASAQTLGIAVLGPMATLVPLHPEFLS